MQLATWGHWKHRCVLLGNATLWLCWWTKVSDASSRTTPRCNVSNLWNEPVAEVRDGDDLGLLERSLQGGCIYALWCCFVFEVKLSHFGSLWFVKATFLGDPAGFHGAGWPRLHVGIWSLHQIWSNNLLSVAKSDVFILQCLVKVFNVMESQNLIRSEAEVQVTAADQENVFPSWWSYERWDVFDFKIFFPHDFCCAFSVSVSCWACCNLLLSWLELQTFNAETVWRIKLHGPGVMFIDSVRRSLTPARCFSDRQSRTGVRFKSQIPLTGHPSINDRVLKNNMSNASERFQIKRVNDIWVSRWVCCSSQWKTGQHSRETKAQKGFGVACFANLKAVNVPIWMCSLQHLRYEDDPALRESPVRIAKAFDC